MKIFIIAMLGVGMAVCVCKGETMGNPPPIAIWHDSYGYQVQLVDGNLTTQGPQLIVAIWDSGVILWSTNAIYGGEPYFCGNVENHNSVHELLRSWEKMGWLSAKYSCGNVGPGAKYIGIFISTGTNTLYTQSWHEIFEQNTNLVARSSGVTALDGRNRETVLQNDKPEYQQYRAAWTEIRAQVNALLPPIGDAVEDVSIKIIKGRPIITFSKKESAR